jgi:hypothetical protein
MTEEDEAFNEIERRSKVKQTLIEALAKQEQDVPYGYVDPKGGGIFIYGEHQFQNTKNVELAPVYLHPKQKQGEDYERGFIDGMQKQTQSSVDRAVNAMVKPWVGLTDEELSKFDIDPVEAKSMIQRLKEKNT